MSSICDIFATALRRRFVTLVPMTTRRASLSVASAVFVGILITGCAAAKPAAVEATAPTATPKPSPTAPRVPVVAGHAPGEFPAVPLFRLPDLSLLDTSASAFTIEVRSDIADIPGVTATPARCDESGRVVSGDGSAFLYGDDAGTYAGPDGAIRNFGDGSGTFTLNGVTVQNFGDGAGLYTDGTVSIQNFGDGSGSYVDASIAVSIYGDGAGTYTDGGVSIQNYGDGAGVYTDGTVSIQNHGDGSGTYTDGSLSIQNDGDGTARVNGTTVKVDPLPPVPPLGVFPPLAALAPVTSCGTTITFADGVLFDFDKSDIRPDAAQTVARVAEVLATYDIPSAIVSGHTDAIGSDEYNVQLSQDRAEVVVAALVSAGVASDLVAEGHGESRPVAANEIDGVDNPAGRQLNRRVEIFLPASH